MQARPASLSAGGLIGSPATMPAETASLLLGIAGAGTMGAGIAAAARAAGVPALLHDPDPAARDRVPDADWAAALADLAPCDVVVEAAPESLDVKRALF